jgi:hypothetical protein
MPKKDKTSLFSTTHSKKGSAILLTLSQGTFGQKLSQQICFHSFSKKVKRLKT